MSSKVAVVIPVYKETLNDFEKISLAQCRKILGKYPLIFVAPKSKKFSYFKSGDIVAYFPQKFFEGLGGYNELMMSSNFCKTFFNYDYILIYQLDAFVFADKLEYFCALGYDYIGAHWIYAWTLKINLNNTFCRPRIGNGGFSLRNVKTCYEMTTKFAADFKNLHELNEDNFFACCRVKSNGAFKVAPISVSYKFSAEFGIERCIKKNGGELPFGCHAWDKFDRNFYVKLFSKFGYDLTPLQNKMSTITEPTLRAWLKKVAEKRLTRRINNHQSLIKYLSKNHYESIRIIRDTVTIKIIAQLLTECPSISDKIFFYNEDETDILIDELTPAKESHLLITAGGGLTPLYLTLCNAKDFHTANVL